MGNNLRVLLDGLLVLAQGASGSVAALAPARVALAAAGGGEPAPAWLVRVLGLRMAIQAGAVSAADRRGGQWRRMALRAGAAVDGLHGASMLAAAVSRRHRRSALVSAGVAFACAGLGEAAARVPAAASGTGPGPAGGGTP